MQEIYDFLKKCGTYFLATTEGSQPRGRPFGTVDIFEGRLYIQTGKVKDVSKQMQSNPQIEICACDGGHWLRITAAAVLDDRVEAQKHMLDGYPDLQSMYKPGDGNTQVFYLKDAVATFASFTDEPRVIHF
nr:pyridoxamine 5'-phosphate oxidase family protein [uncultured Blautia sp.]